MRTSVHNGRLARRPDHRPGPGAASLVRHLGAAALLAVGVDHLEQRSAGHYAAIHTIGTLFLLNFVAAAVVAAALVLPVERLGPRWGDRLHAALALAGVGLSARSAADRR